MAECVWLFAVSITYEWEGECAHKDISSGGLYFWHFLWLCEINELQSRVLSKNALRSWWDKGAESLPANAKWQYYYVASLHLTAVYIFINKSKVNRWVDLDYRQNKPKAGATNLSDRLYEALEAPPKNM